jgi:4-diphosphocytidyl-2-C-methyl-D-erythritol kinase
MTVDLDFVLLLLYSGAMAKRSTCLKIKAPAKINLFLNVLRRRPDGYHELHSILQMISLYDEITFEPVRRGITLASPSRDLPTGGRNLVIQAARRLSREAGVSLGVRMTLKKNIPIGAGLGGGSSDAAATLVVLNRLWGLGYSRGDLARIGQDLGSDIPFFLYGPAAFVAGRGEKVIPCVVGGDRWFVLINPGFAVSTRWVYEQLSSVGVHGATFEKSWLTNIPGNITIQGSNKFTVRYSDLCFHNDLEGVTEPHYPIVREMKDSLQSEGAEGVLMSGSGPTVFGVFEKRIAAVEAASKLSHEHPAWRIWTVKGLRRSPF